MNNKKKQVGILFIHGIGTQKKGETLKIYGDALVQCMGKWLQGARKKKREEPSTESSYSPYVIRDTFISSELHESLPYLEFDVNHPTDNSISERWIFAEAHWADSFIEPKPRETIAWLMKVIPWVWISFTANTLRLSIQAMNFVNLQKKDVFYALRKVSNGLFNSAILFIFAIPITFIFELILILLWCLTLFPIPFIKNQVISVLKSISSIIGDSFIYTSSPIGHGSITSKIIEDIRWLANRCERIVIVAHSQGAAVSYFALQRFIPSNAKLFVTVGSGLNKIHYLKSPALNLDLNQSDNTRQYRFSQFFWLIITVMIFSLLSFLSTIGITLKVLTGILLLSTLVGFYFVAQQTASSKVLYWAKGFQEAGLQWIDIYSDMDPVPNGPLFQEENEYVKSIRVTNTGSLLYDHTAYHLNNEEFNLLLLTLISQNDPKLTKIPFHNLTQEDESIRIRARWLRNHRLYFHLKDKKLLLLGALIAIAFSGNMNEIGIYVQNLFSDLPDDKIWLADKILKSPRALVCLIVIILWLFLRKFTDLLILLIEEVDLRNLYSRHPKVGFTTFLLGFVSNFVVLFLVMLSFYLISLLQGEYEEWSDLPLISNLLFNQYPQWLVCIEISLYFSMFYTLFRAGLYWIGNRYEQL